MGNLGNPPGAHLNNDAAVRSGSDYMEKLGCRGLENVMVKHYPTRHWDITEDGFVREETNEFMNPPLPEQHVSLMCSPLPEDLLAVNRDLLILMAAYWGNIDRYCRLRCPRKIVVEVYCVIRGIHHSTVFAKGCSTELDGSRRGPGSASRFGSEEHDVLRTSPRPTTCRGSRASRTASCTSRRSNRGATATSHNIWSTVPGRRGSTLASLPKQYHG